MGDDLISRNKTLENMENLAFQGRPVKEFIDAVKEQPTAYDVDRVIKELNRNFDITNWDRPYGITLKKAVEIVKSGGIVDE